MIIKFLVTKIWRDFKIFCKCFKKVQKNDIDFRIIAPFYRNIYLKNEIENKKIIGLYLKKEIQKLHLCLKNSIIFF